jgi:transcriptional regulator with XRE-family HTH domain
VPGKKTILNPIHDTATFGGRLRTARVLAGLSLREVARCAGLSHNAVAGYERHQFSPSLYALGLLARLYAVSVWWLADGRTTPEAAEVLARLEPWLSGLPALARERVTLVLRLSPPPGTQMAPGAPTGDQPSANRAWNRP